MLFVLAQSIVETRDGEGSTALMWAFLGEEYVSRRTITKAMFVATVMMTMQIMANNDSSTANSSRGKCSPTTTNNLQETCLMWASMKGNIEGMKTLLNVKCGIDEKSKFLRTALTYAAYRKRVDAVKLLIDSKADIDLAFQRAPEVGWPDAVTLFPATHKGEKCFVLVSAPPRSSSESSKGGHPSIAPKCETEASTTIIFPAKGRDAKTAQGGGEDAKAGERGAEEVVAGAGGASERSLKEKKVLGEDGGGTGARGDVKENAKRSHGNSTKGPSAAEEGGGGGEKGAAGGGKNRDDDGDDTPPLGWDNPGKHVLLASQEKHNRKSFALSWQEVRISTTLKRLLKKKAAAAGPLMVMTECHLDLPIPTKILTFVVEYMRHHNGKASAPIQKPLRSHIMRSV
eukprot:jgi/Bigna1/137163/aug1.37_g11871